MGKVLTRIGFRTPGTLGDFRFEEDSMALKVGQESVIFKGVHEQDCCERVYADFDSAKPYLPQLGKLGEVRAIEIRGVRGEGFLVCFLDANAYHENPLFKVFIPCYNEQNGYYSTELHLEIVQGDVATKVNLHDYKENREY